MSPRREVENVGVRHGAWGETVATDFLRRRGYLIVDSNARPVEKDRRLEIDLVETLILYGTAGPEKKPKLCLEQACFKGFEDLLAKPMGQKKRVRTKK